MVTRERISGYDIIRGVAVASMVRFHWCYDLTALRGIDLPWFSGFFEDAWRASIAWTFLLLAGRMHALSRNDLSRAARYLLVAGGIYIVTTIVAVDIPISFGIIFCMGASTLIFWLLRRTGLRFEHWGWAVGFAIAFALTSRVPSGTLGLGPLSTAVPRGIYECGLFDWLGFPSPAFASGDYYPLIPFAFMYGIGVVWGYASSADSHPAWFLNLRARPIEFIGRHSLLIYVLHQPVLLALLALVPV